MTEVDVFITNYTLVDPEIYQLWIEGHSASEAVAILDKKGLGKQTGASLELIASDVLDHYRTYSLLEKLLSNPNKLQEQLAFQIEPETRQLLIEKYYEFDDVVVKELLGKKLSSKNRKDLDEVSEKTGKPLKSCRRQFDNIKRVFKTVDEIPGSIVENIKSSFYLPDKLARDYASIVFLASIRFETSKKKLSTMTFSAWKRCCEVIMAHWTYKLTGPESYDTEMDKEFLLELRELKVLLDREKEHKQLVSVILKPKLLQKSYAELDSNFRKYTAAIITLGATLHRSRDMRNLFMDFSQILDLFRTGNWTSHDLQQFFNAYTLAGTELDIMRSDADLKSSWEKFMKVVGVCMVVMYIPP
ncbi:acidic fibroblast growth factor intracellular-binding protein [Anthonomus grandis grandis]|uniref:acidic fibroblast growth factor intracellular-binding protein n=1 Tax=Anthonomus grandis grandis TaxID=2921223 RepID=UPI0021652712|nr:acidic fibroblast growth factor intracellular-binding protein [Anthonomus grandis grandis]XP_050313602.1 acidic fibroblast growth factor intracellular-binding protein [Anthonomus grandis grandis]